MSVGNRRHRSPVHPDGLPLRWAVIMLSSIVVGTAVGAWDGPAMGVTVGIACAAGLNQMLPN